MEHRDRAGSADPDANPDDGADDPGDDDYGPPFERRSFGGEFVWARGDGYTAKVLRVRAGEVVAISTRGRRDMTVMLTGGRALLETRAEDNVDRVELLPATPVAISEGEHAYRLVAVTDVELFTIYSPNS